MSERLWAPPPEEDGGVAVPSVFDDPRIRAYVLESAGEQGLRLAKILEGRRETTDSELSAELGEKPSHIRKILYNLYQARVAEYVKEKDKETGWLTFFWRLSPENAEYALDQRRRREIEGLRLQLAEETGHDWYVCPDNHVRWDFSDASEHEFHCEQCGKLLDHADNESRIQEIQRRLVQLEGEGSSA